MSFKVSKSPKFWATVALQMTAEDGRTLKGEIKCQFSRLSREAYEEFNERNKSVPLSKALPEVLHDWKGAEDDDGAVSFTPENFVRWCDTVPGSYRAIAMKFARVHSGLDLLEAREGN